MMSRQDFFPTHGEVIELQRNKIFLIKCDNGRVITATIAARFRTSSGKKGGKKIMQGDKVIVEIPLRDPEKGEIVSFSERKN
jgi:translation initiation factor IF-1